MGRSKELGTHAWKGGASAVAVRPARATASNTRPPLIGRKRRLRRHVAHIHGLHFGAHPLGAIYIFFSKPSQGVGHLMVLLRAARRHMRRLRPISGGLA